MLDWSIGADDASNFDWLLGDVLSDLWYFFSAGRSSTFDARRRDHLVQLIDAFTRTLQRGLLLLHAAVLPVAQTMTEEGALVHLLRDLGPNCRRNATAILLLYHVTHLVARRRLLRHLVRWQAEAHVLSTVQIAIFHGELEDRVIVEVLAIVRVAR